MQSETSARELRGKEIANLPNQINRIDDLTYKVESQSLKDLQYDVVSTELGWLCSCPDSMYRQVKCKHIFAVEFSQALRKSVRKISIVSNPSLIG